MSDKPLVLLITKSNDNECVESVIQALHELGGEAFRFDTDRFPTELRLALSYEGTGRRLLAVPDDAPVVDLDRVSALWNRRFEIAARLPGHLDRQIRAASMAEARRVIFSLLGTLNCFRLDPRPNIELGSNKHLQLQVAQRVGLTIPRTLITNDPASVRLFAKECKENIITKMQESFAIYENGEEKVVFTSPVSEEDLADLTGLALCPMQFQERLDKALELRVTVVGQSVFAYAVDSQSSTMAKDDWRKDGLALVEQWQPYTLPADVQAALLRLMDALGLNFGATDFILTPDGRHVFLEVNPVGEYFWLDALCDHAISREIARVLLGQAERRANVLPKP